jgi:Tol biopolymer transport system component
MIILLLSVVIYGLSHAQDMIFKKKPPPVPELFGESIISTNLYERDMALSPDGKEIFYTLQSPLGILSTIMYMRKTESGQWSLPVVAPFSGHYSDMEPTFRPDGKAIYFVSNRPLTGDSAKDFDIWIVEKNRQGWAKPVNLGSPVNTSENEFYPSIAASGNLYFTANYPRGKGKEDIYLAKWEHDHWSEPVSLDTGVNSALYEFNAFVSPEEDYIIFSSFGRKDDHGRGDLYISFKSADGSWKPAKNLALINSEKLDYCPFVSFDKKIFFFTSEKNSLKSFYGPDPADLKTLKESYTGIMNGEGNIYWISLGSLLSSVQKD